MKTTLSVEQKQTENTFDFKWKKRSTYESDAISTEWKRWLIEKYFDGNEAGLSVLLKDGEKKILDAGCGAGGSGMHLFGEHLNQHDYYGVDISDAVNVAKERFAEKELKGTFIKASLLDIPESVGNFDIIFSEGVLHHTDSVEESIMALSKRLRPGGHFLFYVYIKKAPIREFTDDYVREYLRTLSDEDAWATLEPLTKLGKALGDLDIEIDVPEDIPFLGIKKGKQNLQRLFFYKICKAYYRPEYSIDEMNHINFDWFRPLNCFRHTPEEVKAFCDKAGLTIEKLSPCESGITVIAKK